MKAHLMTLAYGVLIWLVPFALGMVIFPIVPPESALFDTIMSVTLAFAATLFSYLCFRSGSFEHRGVASFAIVGVIWLLLAVLLDAPMFLISNFTGMSRYEYFADIGLNYLTIPIIALGVGLAFTRNSLSRSAAE